MNYYSLFSVFGLLICSLLAYTNEGGEVNSRSISLLNSAKPIILNQRSVQAIKIDSKGKTYNTEILKQQLANDIGLPLRDFRIVDPLLPKQIKATFAARPKAILFCIENIKVVIQRNEALVFNANNKEVQEFLTALKTQIQQNNEAKNQTQILFEHVVIEAALNVVCSNLFKRVRLLAPVITSTLHVLQAQSRGMDVKRTQADELLPLKNQIDELENRVKEIKRAVHDVLENDESRLMYLSDSNDPKTAYVHKKLKDDCDLDSNDEKFDTMYVEMMFEAYLNELEWIAAEIEEIIDEITNTEESVELQIDLLRNRILKFELMLSIASFVGTCAAVVTGLFGMNLLSHLESNIFGFYTISFLLVVGCGTLYKVLVTTAKRDALF